jgi:hypothetical protein
MVVTFAVSVMVYLSWQAWAAGRNSLSDVFARPAINYLEAKAAADLRLSEDEWQAVHDSISRADALMPGNPAYLDRLGWLEQTKVSLLADALDIDQIDAHARAAEEYYRSATQARPTWPYYWGSIVLQMHRRGNYDKDEYSVALANAARFGPWQDDTQRLVADLGSDTLEFLLPSAQREFLLNLERGLNRQPEVLLPIIRDRDIVCEAANVPDDSLPLLSSFCERDGND